MAKTLFYTPYETLSFVLNIPERVLDEMTGAEMQEVVDSLLFAMKVHAKVSRLMEDDPGELTSTSG